MKNIPPVLARPAIEKTDLGDNSFLLKSRHALQPYSRCVGEWLEHWSRCCGERIFLGERRGDGWATLTYKETRQRVGRIAQGLLDLGLTAKTPVCILSENSIDHALISFAAMHVGVPVATISSTYSRIDVECGKLIALVNEIQPGLIYAGDGEAYANALNKLAFSNPVVVSSSPEVYQGACLLTEIEAEETPAVMQAFQQITPETHARYLLTSGSTGTPKAVINTQRMLCANQQSMAQVWRFLEEETLVVCDWLPWSHTFGVNHNLNMILRNGGTFYIDDGKPMPGLIDRSVENIKMIKPTMVFNVPRGYEMFSVIAAKDEEFKKSLFERALFLFYAAAALPTETWNSLKKLALEVRETIPIFTASWGATETAPALTNIHFDIDKPGNLGVPIPGIEIKFVPSGDKLEMRVRGDSITPGYLNQPTKTAEAFDEDGFYLIQDAGKLIDPDNPNLGIAFDGRVTEDFKLTTGTWVSVGVMRPALVGEFAPLAMDFVICGQNRDEVGALMFATPALKEIAGKAAEGLSTGQLAELPEVREKIKSLMLSYKNKHTGSSQHLQRLLIMDNMPDIAAGEITDKGYINQRACLSHREHMVEKLYDDNNSLVISL